MHETKACRCCGAAAIAYTDAGARRILLCEDCLAGWLAQDTQDMAAGRVGGLHCNYYRLVDGTRIPVPLPEPGAGLLVHDALPPDLANAWYTYAGAITHREVRLAGARGLVCFRRLGAVPVAIFLTEARGGRGAAYHGCVVGTADGEQGPVEDAAAAQLIARFGLPHAG